MTLNSDYTPYRSPGWCNSMHNLPASRVKVPYYLSRCREPLACCPACNHRFTPDPEASSHACPACNAKLRLEYTPHGINTHFESCAKHTPVLTGFYQYNHNAPDTPSVIILFECLHCETQLKYINLPGTLAEFIDPRGILAPSLEPLRPTPVLDALRAGASREELAYALEVHAHEYS